MEISLGIKTEKKTPAKTSPAPKEISTATAAPNAWMEEKRKLVAKIVALQTQNQNITFELQTKSSEWDALVKEKSKMERDLSAKMYSLTEDLNSINSNLDEQKKHYNETIAQLKCENKTLQARIKQLQVGTHLQKDSSSDDEVNDASAKEYDIERLLDHKKKKDGMHYLVRWKNFTSADDTWEPEAQMMGPLETYKKKMNL